MEYMSCVNTRKDYQLQSSLTLITLSSCFFQTDQLVNVPQTP